MYVPARARQMDDNGDMVMAADLLSGSVVGAGSTGNGSNIGGNGSSRKNNDGKSFKCEEDETKSADLIAFD